MLLCVCACVCCRGGRCVSVGGGRSSPSLAFGASESSTPRMDGVRGALRDQGSRAHEISDTLMTAVKVASPVPFTEASPQLRGAAFGDELSADEHSDVARIVRSNKGDWYNKMQRLIPDCPHESMMYQYAWRILKAAQGNDSKCTLVPPSAKSLAPQLASLTCSTLSRWISVGYADAILNGYAVPRESCSFKLLTPHCLRPPSSSPHPLALYSFGLCTSACYRCRVPVEWMPLWETEHRLGDRGGFDYHRYQVFVEMDSYSPAHCVSVSGILSDTENTYFLFGNREGAGSARCMRVHVVSFTAGSDIESRIALASLFRRFVRHAGAARAARRGYDLASLLCKSESGHVPVPAVARKKATRTARMATWGSS